MSETTLNTLNKKAANWLHRIILPCTEVTRILSETPERPLTWRGRVALRVHLVMCAWCSRYKSQLKRLRISLHCHTSDAEAPDSVGLSPEARDRINRSLSGKES